MRSLHLNSRGYVSILWLAAMIVLLWNSPLSAQFTTASLEGTVVDPSGAVVPDAKVIVRNIDTGFKETTQTGATGTYLFPRLPIGNYRLTVEKPGFFTYVQEGITLTVNRAASQVVTLRVGEVTEKVTVAADAELVTTGDAAVGQLIDSRRVIDLPLEGRTPQKLVFLAAGAVNATDRYCGFNCFGGVAPGAQQAVVNGSGPGSIFYSLDGVAHNDTYLNFNLPFPNPDSLQEFNLQQNNMSAEYGSSASGIVNIVTKSGTNEIHGSVFEFLRNGALNSRDFFAPIQDPLKRNQFGFSLGGPIRKDKLFYFGNYQGTRQTRAPAGRVAFVPTQAERNGDFSSVPVQLVDPDTGAPFLNNQIPVSRFSAPALYFLDRIPLPQGPGRQLTFAGAPARPRQDEATVKTDYLAGKHQFSARYFINDYDLPPVTPPTDNILAADNQGSTVRVQSWGVNYIYTISPTLLINGWYGYNRERGGSISSAPFNYADAGILVARPSIPPGELAFSVGGAFNVDTSHPGIFDRDDHSIRGTLTHIRGGHELRFGMEVNRVQNQINNTFTQAGSFSFSNSFSGDNLADFMLGRPSQFMQGGGEFKDLIGNRWGGFAQDNWRVGPRFTLNLGIRWDPYFPYTERGGRFLCFQPGVKSTRYPNAPPGMTFAGENHDPGCPRTGIYSDKDKIAPRVGFAYKLTADGKTSLRGGAGFFYNAVSTDAQTSHFNAPFAPVFNFGQSGIDFQDPWGSVGVPDPFPDRFGGLNIPGPDVTFVTPTALQFTLSDAKTPLLQAWNLTLERQIKANWLFRIAYVGNKGTHMTTTFKCCGERNPAIYIPGQSTPGNTQQRRPYQDFTSVTSISDTVNNSHYNALQVNIEKRFSAGFSLLANYTWSKLIDDHGWTNPYNRRFDYGISDDDVAHHFSLSHVWQVPKANVSGVGGQILNGWELTSIMKWRGGFPFSVLSNCDCSLSAVFKDRADLVKSGSAQLSSGRPHGEMVENWFDTSFFGPNTEGTFGNSGKNILRGPKLFNVDLGLIKNTHITERVSVQFRAEFFNAFNNVNFNPPGNVVGTEAYGRLTSTVDQSFRIIQFAFKILF